MSFSHWVYWPLRPGDSWAVTQVPQEIGPPLTASSPRPLQQTDRNRWRRPDVARTALHEQTRDRLGKYRLIAQLGRGGMADVYLAVANGIAEFSKLLVVKELRREQADDDFFVKLFLDEARLAARLNHPNVVQAIEVGSDGLRHFLVMEYLDGQPLHRVLRRAPREGQPLATELCVRVLPTCSKHSRTHMRRRSSTAACSGSSTET